MHLVVTVFQHEVISHAALHVRQVVYACLQVIALSKAVLEYRFRSFSNYGESK